MEITLRVNLPIQMALIVVEGITVTEGKAGYDLLTACAAEYTCKYVDQGITSPGSVEGVKVARDLFRAVGIDPTKHRPSSEKLLNRVLKGKQLPAINTLVDVGNWFSLHTLLPVGIYDCDKLAGSEIVLREGVTGESYTAIGNSEINLAGRYLLADAEGPFGTPITDSLRTAVTAATRNTALFVYGPRDYAYEMLMEKAELLSGKVREICCGGGGSSGGDVCKLVYVNGVGSG